MEIAQHTRQCLEAFNQLQALMRIRSSDGRGVDDAVQPHSSTTTSSCDPASKQDNHETRCQHTRSEHLQLTDELGRFNIWFQNLSAHRPLSSRRSLEYRLRDSTSLRTLVLSLLSELQDALGRLKNIVQPSASPEANAKHDSRDTPLHSGGHTATNEEISATRDDQSFLLSDEDQSDDSSDGSTPAQLTIDEIHDTITCLNRFSMALRNPSRNDQRRNDPLGKTEHFVPFDTSHVREKFPDAPEFLVERLGRTLSSHRQYLRYRKSHHEKLKEDNTVEAIVAEEEVQSTVASALPNHFSDLPTIEHMIALEEDVESNFTATSYEGTSAESSRLPMPSWPLGARDGEPFECPLCYAFITAPTEQAWGRHVFEDLPPYVCTYEDCAVAADPFPRRRHWSHHEAQVHNRTWSCPFGCTESFNTQEHFSSHVTSSHSSELDQSALAEMSKNCVQVVERVWPSACPLCQKLCVSDRRWTHHVGHHLQQLALFASTHLQEDDDDFDDDEDDGDRSQESIMPIYEAYTITLLDKIITGEPVSWLRTKKVTLSLSSETLHDKAVAYGRKTGTRPSDQFRALGANQQSIVNRVVDGKNSEERNPNVIWGLFCVKRNYVDIKSGPRIYKTNNALRVTLKRRGRFRDVPPASQNRSSYEVVAQPDAIIDLTLPPPSGHKQSPDTKRRLTKAAKTIAQPDPFIDLNLPQPARNKQSPDTKYRLTKVPNKTAQPSEVIDHSQSVRANDAVAMNTNESSRGRQEESHDSQNPLVTETAFNQLHLQRTERSSDHCFSPEDTAVHSSVETESSASDSDVSSPMAAEVAGDTGGITTADGTDDLDPRVSGDAKATDEEVPGRGFAYRGSDDRADHQLPPTSSPQPTTGFPLSTTEEQTNADNTKASSGKNIAVHGRSEESKDLEELEEDLNDDDAFAVAMMSTRLPGIRRLKGRE